ncbi:MAG: hypothetical protein MUO26_06905 [Methanotrichaceae archaeon]|jgi:hypothetical protein|nr:hypothetical protein [Methanotrichaceae archaeon]
MTQTMTRGIRLAITETLAKYGIDNVVLDMELTKVITDIIQIKKPQLTTEQINKNTEKAYFASLSNNSVGYEQFPEDIRPYAEKFCTLYKLTPPIKPRKESERSEFSYWIISLRELANACGEYGSDLLIEMRSEYESEMVNGAVPFRVNSPSSLVKTARGKAGMKRQGISGVIKQGKPEHQSRLDV